MLEGIPVSNIIFTGDEFNDGGVDYPIYLLQQERGNGEMVVINTNGYAFDGVISLNQIDGFSSDNTPIGNVRRNILLQSLILSIVEENIGLIATDEEYEPVNVAQELKNKIYDFNVIDFETEIEHTDIDNFEDVLKAG